MIIAWSSGNWKHRTVQLNGEYTLREKYTFNLKRLHWSHLLTGKQDRSGGQAQFEICSRGFSQVTGSRCEVQHIVHQLQDTESERQPALNRCSIVYMLRYAAFRLRSELGCKHDLEGDADIPPILEGYFMNFRVGIHQDGNLKTTTTTHRHNSQSTTTDGSSVETRASLHSETYAWGWNVHTALQLFAMRLAVFLKVFSR